MFKTILAVVLTSIVAAFATGCAATSPFTGIAFEPRAYPYVPEMGPDGPSSSAKALATK